MFDRVWRWAGKYRTTERNLGVKPFEIEPAHPRADELTDDQCYFLLQRPLSLRFAATGAGNPALREAGRKSMRNCGR
jgi:hypothetical protein